MVPESAQVIDPTLRMLAAPDGAEDAEAVAAAGTGPHSEELIEAVVAHRLHGAFVDATVRAGVPVDERIGSFVADDRLVRLRIRRALGAAAEALDAASVPWLAFKGATIASLMHKPELRTYNDLDLLVSAARFGEAVELLGDVGFAEVNRNWAPYVRHRVGEVPLEVDGITVDLHWHVVGLARDRKDLRFQPAAMLARRRRRPVFDRPIAVFDAEDQLLHLTVHSALSGATRLDQLRDLAVAVREDPVDWTAFVARTRAAGVSKMVGHALDRSASVLGADVPAAVREELAGARSLARRRRLDGPAVGGLRGMGIVWRRDSLGASMRALLSRADTVRPRRRGTPTGWDFADERSRLYRGTESGGPEMRDAFMRAVAGWD